MLDQNRGDPWVVRRWRATQSAHGNMGESLAWRIKVYLQWTGWLQPFFCGSSGWEKREIFICRFIIRFKYHILRFECVFERIEEMRSKVTLLFGVLGGNFPGWIFGHDYRSNTQDVSL